MTVTCSTDQVNIVRILEIRLWSGLANACEAAIDFSVTPFAIGFILSSNGYGRVTMPTAIEYVDNHFR